jgi:hypothetical protein
MKLPEWTSPLAGDVSSFVAIARRIFHDQPWDAVSLYVQRAWQACEVSEYMRWQDAEPLIRRAWDERE